MGLQTMLRAGVTSGTFIKTAHPHVVELPGTTGLAFAVIDVTHAIIAAARAAGRQLGGCDTLDFRGS